MNFPCNLSSILAYQNFITSHCWLTYRSWCISVIFSCHCDWLTSSAKKGSVHEELACVWNVNDIYQQPALSDGYYGMENQQGLGINTSPVQRNTNHQFYIHNYNSTCSIPRTFSLSSRFFRLHTLQNPPSRRPTQILAMPPKLTRWWIQQ